MKEKERNKTRVIYPITISSIVITIIITIGLRVTGKGITDFFNERDKKNNQKELLQKDTRNLTDDKRKRAKVLFSEKDEPYKPEQPSENGTATYNIITNKTGKVDMPASGKSKAKIKDYLNQEIHFDYGLGGIITLIKENETYYVIRTFFGSGLPVVGYAKYKVIFDNDYQITFSEEIEDSRRNVVEEKEEFKFCIEGNGYGLYLNGLKLSTISVLNGREKKEVLPVSKKERITIKDYLNQEIRFDDGWAGQSITLIKENETYFVLRTFFGSGLPVTGYAKYKVIFDNDYQITFSDVIEDSRRNAVKKKEEFIFCIEENGYGLYLNGERLSTILDKN